jgi:dynactin 1
LVDAKRQKREYEEAMEQLQADLDGLEQDNARLKVVLGQQEKQGLFVFFCGFLF